MSLHINIPPNDGSYCHSVNGLGDALACFDLPVRWFDSTGSTNDEAKKIAAKNEIRKAVLFAAAFQTQGRGQREKKWAAPQGSCILTSVAVPPEWVSWNPLLFKWAGAWAVCETCVYFGVSNVTIKLPNDVLVNGKKISGILLETAYREGRLISCVLGVGINVSFKTLPDSETFPLPPTSFALEKISVTLSDVYRTWVEKMDALLSEFQKRNASLADRIEPWVREQDRRQFHKEIVPVSKGRT